MAFFLASFSRSSAIRQKLQNAKLFAFSSRTNLKKKNLKKMLQKKNRNGR
jgi:hypothetical protein